MYPMGFGHFLCFIYILNYTYIYIFFFFIVMLQYVQQYFPN